MIGCTRLWRLVTSSRARLSCGHRAPFLVDVLEERHVLEEVDAFVALAFDAPQSLGRRVEIEGMHAEGLDESLGHLGRTHLAARGHHPWRDVQPSSNLLLGQAHGHRRVGRQVLGLKAV
jgi:hypothetical protein